MDVIHLFAEVKAIYILSDFFEDLRSYFYQKVLQFFLGIHHNHKLFLTRRIDSQIISKASFT